MTQTQLLTPETPTSRPSLFQRLADNPVIIKELRGRMRGRRAFLLLTGYLTVISVFIGLIYLLMVSEASYSQSDPQFRQTVGKVIFGTVVLLELLLVSFIGPALTAGAISSERERQTFDLLRTTLISAPALVFGKLGSALAYLLLLIVAALPIQSLAFLLGGVGLAELLISSLMLVVTALFFAALGLFFSSFVKRTLTATVSSYIAIVVSFLGLGMVFFVAVSLNLPYASSNQWAETVLTLLLWAMVSANPLLAAIFSEVILIEDQSLFFTQSLFGSSVPPLLSPWIPFTALYLATALIMIMFSIHFVSRPDR